MECDCSPAEFAAKNGLSAPCGCECLAAYVLWVAPLVAGANCLVFAGLCAFMGQSLTVTKTRRASLGAPPEHAHHAKARIFGWVVAVSILAIWCAASVAGAGMSVSNAVVSFAVVLFIMVGAVVVSTIGWNVIRTEVMHVPLVQKVRR